MTICKNKLSGFPFLTGCTNTQFVIPILLEESGVYRNYNIEFADFVCSFNNESPDTYISAGTYSSGYIYFSGHGINFSVDVTALLDDTNTYVTGGTMSGDTLLLFRNDGGQISIDQSQFNYSSQVSYLNGKIDSHTGNTSIHFTVGSINLNEIGSSAHTHTISEITDYVVPFDIYVTGGTMSGDTLILTRNDGESIFIDESQFNYSSQIFYTNDKIDSHTGNTSIHFTVGSINLNEIGNSAHTHTVSEIIGDFGSFTGNTSATCINDLYVHNLGGCSPINILTDITLNGNISAVPTIIPIGFSVLCDFDVTNGYQPVMTPTVYNNKIYGTTNQGGVNGVGVLFEYDPTTNLLNVVRSYDGAGGSRPTAGVLAHNNKFYGTNFFGDTYNVGNLYEFNPSTLDYNILVTFNGTNGSSANTQPIVSGNTLYSVTQNGGVYGSGTIYKYDLDISAHTIFYSFNSPTGNLPQGLLIYNDYFYGVTYAGGAANNGVIYKFNIATSTYTVLHTFDGSSNGGQPSSKLIVYNNKFYGTTRIGGVNTVGVIFEFDPNTEIYSIIHSFDSSGVGSGPRLFLTVYNDKFYGVCMQGGDIGQGTLYEFDPNTLSYTMLESFNYVNGYEPYSPPVFYKNGLYGVAYRGGLNSAGTLYRYQLNEGQVVNCNIGVSGTPITNIYTESITIQPTYIPTGPTDVYGSIGQVVWGDGYIYLKTENGWGRTLLDMIWP